MFSVDTVSDPLISRIHIYAMDSANKCLTMATLMGRSTAVRFIANELADARAINVKDYLMKICQTRAVLHRPLHSEIQIIDDSQVNVRASDKSSWSRRWLSIEGTENDQFCLRSSQQAASPTV